MPSACALRPPVRCDGDSHSCMWCYGCPRVDGGHCCPSSFSAVPHPCTGSSRPRCHAVCLGHSCVLPARVTAASGCTGRFRRHLERSSPSPVLPLPFREHRGCWLGGGTRGLRGSGRRGLGLVSAFHPAVGPALDLQVQPAVRLSGPCKLRTSTLGGWGGVCLVFGRVC